MLGDPLVNNASIFPNDEHSPITSGISINEGKVLKLHAIVTGGAQM